MRGVYRGHGDRVYRLLADYEVITPGTLYNLAQRLYDVHGREREEG